METRRECWFLGTWVSRRSVDSESENWPRRPGRDWLHGRPPSTPWPSSLAVVRWQVRKRFVWVHRFVLCGGLVLSAVSEGRCGPGPPAPTPASPRSGRLPDYRGESPSALAHEDAQPCPSKRCGCLLTVTLAVTLAQRAERPAGRSPCREPCPGGHPVPTPPRQHPLPLRIRPAPSSFRGPCRGACGAPPGVRAGVRALCRDGALCGDAAPCPGVSPVLSLIRPLAPGRWPQSSPRPLPGAPAGPAAPS